MQEIFVLTPVTDPSRLGAMYRSMEHADVPVLIHWMVIFDAQHANYFKAWKNVFDFGQIDNVLAHCILSDQYLLPNEAYLHINSALDILENHVATETPHKRSAWVYQLDDTEQLPPSLCLYLHEFERVVTNYDMIMMNKLLYEQDKQKYVFRLKCFMNGLRYQPKTNDFVARLMRSAKNVMHTGFWSKKFINSKA